LQSHALTTFPEARSNFPGPEELNIRDSQLTKGLAIAQAAFYVCEHDFGRTLMDARAS
jgi:hypothetical protein